MQPDELSGSALRQVFSDLADIGYALNFSVVDAADYGAPQHRLRFIMFGSREGAAPEMPIPTHGPLSPQGTPWRTVRDAIFDLRDQPGAHSRYTPDVAKYFELIPPGGNWRQLPKPLQSKALGQASFQAGGGKTGFFRRLDWHSPSPTITGRANRKGSALCHPEFTRPLSVIECARLQGFPGDWHVAGSMSDQYQQIGNAVPVALGTAVGRAILSLDYVQKPARAAASIDLLLEKAIRRLRQSARNKVSRRKPVAVAQLELFAAT
jgi:DNA (cytosine-5)-methyltransferase 1